MDFGYRDTGYNVREVGWFASEAQERRYEREQAKTKAELARGETESVARAMARPSQYAARMRFSVITANEAETVYDGTFKVEDSGMLTIIPDNEEEPTIRLSPAFWRQINEPRSSYDVLDSVR